MDENQVKENFSDAEENKVMGILAYILFFIPILAARQSKFAMYHANQGLTLFLAAVIINIIGTIIPVIGWFIILPLGNLGILILVIMGIIKAAGGKTESLPLIGKFTLLRINQAK